MKAHYTMPSCDYNLCLTKEDLRVLQTTESLVIQTRDIPTTANRTAFDFAAKDFVVIDERDIDTYGLTLLEYVGGEKYGEHHPIQFLRILVDSEANRKPCGVCRFTGDLPTYILKRNGEAVFGDAHFCPECGRYLGGLPRYSGNC